MKARKKFAEKIWDGMPEELKEAEREFYLSIPKNERYELLKAACSAAGREVLESDENNIKELQDNLAEYAARLANLARIQSLCGDDIL